MQDDTYIVSVKPTDRRHRARDTVLTLLMWGLYIYLWIPLITLTAWLLGFERFYTVMISYGGFAVALGLLDLYALMIIGIVICVLSWSGINYYRFHSRERRNSTAAADLHAICEVFGLPVEEAERARSARRLQIDLDQLGGILKIEYNIHLGSDVQVYSAETGIPGHTAQAAPEALSDH